MLDGNIRVSYKILMNKLSSKERAKILYMLCEGNSIRSIVRITGASKNTISKLLIDAGKACAAYHETNVRDLKTTRIEVYEIWSFTYAKQKNAKTAKAAPTNSGDTWIWTAIDADSRMLMSYLVGGRDAEYAMWFMDDLRSRLANRVQLTSDEHISYIQGAEGASGADVDCAQLIRMYGNAPESFKCQYSPADCKDIKKRRIEGEPEKKLVSASYVERANLTMRMHMRRFTGLTEGFSKKIENHAYAVALHMMYYNFVRIHKTLRMSPAMSAGVSNTLWKVKDIVKLVELAEVKPKKRGPFKKNFSN